LFVIYLGPQTFTDLAEMVAKVRGPVNRNQVAEDSDSGTDYDSGDEEDPPGYVSEPYESIYGNQKPELAMRYRHKRNSLSEMSDDEDFHTTSAQY
jgi:hypothetical protein